jgi:uncharacterized protein with ParB-like and HNH nuclease domain
MSNFIFSISEIFTKCLTEHKVDGYYIGPYQRGYKWKSKTIHDQVPVLLSDLYDAFLKGKLKQGTTEYYLQYITVKRTPRNGSFTFEVIDGQQRLTTITLLFNVLERYFDEENLAKSNGRYLLEYSRYSGSESNIFDLIVGLAEDTATEIEKIEQQHKFYLYHAFKTIQAFFNLLKEQKPEDFKEFLGFIKEDVKIILNKEDEFTSAEEVFSSLNANKVPLTNAYLIKGLLLTKAARVSSIDGQKKHFKEILDARSLMAKTWDEMHSWFCRPDVSKYYFGNENAGMDAALGLIEHNQNEEKENLISLFRDRLEKSKNKFDNQYELFNQFHERTITNFDAIDYLNKIKHLYKRLCNWYEDNNWYNLIGFYLHTDGLIKNLILKPQIQLKKTLYSHVNRQITYSIKENGNQTEKDISLLRYDNNPGKRIHKILLALSVFPEGVDREKESNYRFDFYAYANEGWSLEHIFPQNPDQEDIDYTEDTEWVIEQCIKNNKQDIITKIKNGEVLGSQEVSFIYDSFPDVHIFGNMALLSSAVNSALSNGLFNTKRKILIQKINSGSFVPKHTIDVFSKMLEAKIDENDTKVEFEQDIKIWTEEDAQAHLVWIKNRVAEIKKEFA